MANPMVTAALLSWLAAQLVKVGVGILRYGQGDCRRMLWRVVWAGGMPSAHSALMTSCLTTLYLSAGAQSPLFGLCLVVAGIVMYDRSRAYAIYRTFQNRYPEVKQAAQQDPVLRDLIGHRMGEIAVGILIGWGCGFAVIRWL
jgi:acid phosphatase family membrane protein YuiD